MKLTVAKIGGVLKFLVPYKYITFNAGIDSISGVYFFRHSKSLVFPPVIHLLGAWPEKNSFSALPRQTFILYSAHLKKLCQWGWLGFTQVGLIMMYKNGLHWFVKRVQSVRYSLI